MKRYRVISFEFDKRAFILSMEISELWEESVKESWRIAKNQIENGLINEYGIFNVKRKIDDFKILGCIPFSVVAFHNKFLVQARNAFVEGAYYPCLTASCALGERILNHLILRLRDYYRGTDEYKKVYDKDSFDNWDLAIGVLKKWNIFSDAVKADYEKLRDIRNKALHFNPDVDRDERSLAISSFQTLCRIIESQFGIHGQSWFISEIDGGAYIRKDAEVDPFVKEIVLPSCALVGYLHKMKKINGKWVVEDDNIYEEREISDEEYCKLIKRK